MRMRYINEVKKNLSIYSTKKSTNILDGSYISIFKGRTQNFEDLRGYVSGDNVKDIDWKSSARSQTLLVRRYIAEKKHNIMIVADTGKKMLADTEQGDSKKEVAVMTAATVAYIAHRNGDYVSMAYRHNEKLEICQKHSNLYESEQMIAHFAADIDSMDGSNMESTLELIGKKVKDRSVIFVITDLSGMNEISAETLRRLTVRHDVLCICISDAKLAGETAFDVEAQEDIPAIFRKNKQLLKYEEQQIGRMEKECEQKFLRNQIISIRISTKKEVVGKLIELLGRHKHANRG